MPGDGRRYAVNQTSYLSPLYGSQMADDSKSIRWVVTAAMIFVAYLAWGFMAGSYAESSHVGGVIIGRRGLIAASTMLLSAIYSFVATSIWELPNFFSVISWHFSNRIWLPILFILLEVAIVFGGVGLQRLEDNLSKSRGRRNR